MTLIIKEFVDLSLPIRSLDTSMFPGLPQPLRTTFSTIREGGYLQYLWMFVEHTGTHLDAPAHVIEGGQTIDEIPISRCAGYGAVLDFSDKPPKYLIEREDILRALEAVGKRGKVGPGWVLLFYTGYTSKMTSQEWLDHPGLKEDACKLIAEMQVNAIGFDAPSPNRDPSPAHRNLLPTGIGAYENLTKLEKLLNRDFIFIGEPIRLVGSTGSPVRAIAIIIEGIS